MASDVKAEVAWIGLGSNQGDRIVNLTHAAADLSVLPGTSLLAASSIYRTEPLGEGFAEDFFNAVVGIRTTLSPLQLLKACGDIEVAFGRDRSRADRMIDLDILLYGDVVLETPGLTVPHPKMAQRRFVLEPLAEIAPETIHPLTNVTVAEMLSGIEEQQRVERLQQPLFPVAGC